jgi:hypothetical protein
VSATVDDSFDESILVVVGRVDSPLLRRLEQLNGVARGVVENDLRASGSSDDVIAELESSSSKAFDLSAKVFDVYVNTIPSPRNRLATIGHGSTAGTGLSAQQ